MNLRSSVAIFSDTSRIVKRSNSTWIGKTSGVLDGINSIPSFDTSLIIEDPENVNKPITPIKTTTAIPTKILGFIQKTELVYFLNVEIRRI